MPSIIDRVLKISDNRVLKRMQATVDAVNLLEDDFRALSDAELRAETDALRARHADGESLDLLLPEAFAAVREAAGRTLGQRHYDVQLLGGIALHQGNIAEMKTGEGKTLVATAPAYLNALSGRGVHVVTVNDFLASYQADLMGRVFRFLGMQTGVIVAGQTPAVRREQYAADITYGTNNEFGFDFLRDNMAWSLDELVQREHHYAIVDEVDSILIDEARTPLIISGPAQGEANRWYGEFARLVRRLEADTDYEVDHKKRTVGILGPGIEKVEDHLGITNLYETQNTTLIQFLNNAVKAKELFKRDKDYVVLDGEVQIVDEHTGRVLKGRRYNEGLHQAIEAKEGVEVKPENQTLATVTLQNYFRGYEKLAGMTGTAETEAAEFTSTYGLGVVVIPPNRERQRVDRNDVVYKNEKVKFDAVVDDIAERHAKGQPVLVGTTSVEKSEYLSTLLAKRGVRHEVLNAKNHAREAAIVAQAGRPGAVTVATNMAGRGTDIMLGGNAEFTAVARMQELGLDAAEDPEAYEARWPEVLAEAEAAVEDAHRAVIEAGGLYVVGTERHDSRRIDNQLRGRSGRQGDPGESRFYLSLTDELMRNFNPGVAQRIMNSPSIPDDMALEFGFVSKAIQNAQAQVEGRNAEQRKNVLKYDDVMNRQREAIYTDRRSILEGRTCRTGCAASWRTPSGTSWTRPPRRATPPTGTSTSCGGTWQSSTPWASRRRTSSTRSAAGAGSRPRSSSANSSPMRSWRTRTGRRRWGPRRCGRRSVAWCSPPSGAAGRSISTRWTTSRRASGCARWPSASPSWSTSARATRCSRTCSPPSARTPCARCSRRRSVRPPRRRRCPASRTPAP